MLINLICTLLSVLGIYGFYSDNYIFLIIGSIAVIFETIIGLITGELKGLFIEIIASIIGIFFTKNILVGIGVGLCYESIIMSICGWFMVLINMIIIKKTKK